MKTLGFSCLLALLVSEAAIAGHANPWATDEDTVNSQYHEQNLAQSLETPGEDEMLGVMVRDAHGKLDAESAAKGGGDKSGGKKR